MASAVPKEPPRVVCTKCVRIVKVHWWDIHFADNSMFIVTECCERVCGFISGERLFAYARSYDKRDFTVGDITRMSADDAKAFAEEHEARAEKAAARAKWARWSL